MDDLIAFLRARLDEDEAVARNAAVLPHGAADWHTGAEGSVFAAEPSQLHVRGAILSLDDIGTHIARWDPARVLAEVEAKRRMIDGVHPQVVSLEDAIHGEFSAYPEVDVPVLLLKTLALPYASHADYRPEWRS